MTHSTCGAHDAVIADSARVIGTPVAVAAALAATGLPLLPFRVAVAAACRGAGCR